MSLISRITTWVTGSELSASNLNAEFDNIIDWADGEVSNVNLAADAGIVDTKLAQITTVDKVADTALSESATGILRGQTGINTTVGKVWKFDGSVASLADSTDPLLLDYFLSVANGVTGEGKYEGVVEDTFAKGLKYLGTAGALVDNIDGLASGSWIIQIGFAPTTSKLVIMNPNGRSFGKKR